MVILCSFFIKVIQRFATIHCYFLSSQHEISVSHLFSNLIYFQTSEGAGDKFSPHKCKGSFKLPIPIRAFLTNPSIDMQLFGLKGILLTKRKNGSMLAFTLCTVKYQMLCQKLPPCAGNTHIYLKQHPLCSEYTESGVISSA